MCNTSALLVNDTITVTGASCATNSAGIVGQLADAGNNCSAPSTWDNSSSIRDLVNYFAGSCCNGGLAAKNQLGLWACADPRFILR